MRSRTTLTTTPQRCGWRAVGTRPAIGATLVTVLVSVPLLAPSIAMADRGAARLAAPVARAASAARTAPVARARPTAATPTHAAFAAQADPAAHAGSAREAAGLHDLVAHRWPSLPDARQLTLSQQLTDRLTDVGNLLGDHLDLLSREMLQLRVDARNRRAHIRVGAGGGDDDLLTLRVDGDIQFHNLNARVDAHIDLGFRSHRLRLELPAFHVQATEYLGDYGVQLEIPVFERRF